MADRNDHILALDQIFVFEVIFNVGDLGAARRGEFRADSGEFIADDGQHALARTQNVEIVSDLFAECRQLVTDFVAAQSRQALQTQIKNGAGLYFGQPVSAVIGQLMARIGDQHDQRFNVGSGPVACHQPFARCRRIGRGADQLDHFVDIGNSNGEADQNVSAVTRLAEFKLRTPRHDFFAEVRESRDELLEVHQLRPAAINGHHVGTEGRLQRRETVKLVQHHIGHRVALKLDDNAHAVAVGFIAQIGNAVDAFVAHQFSNAFDHRGLVHLIGNFADDDRRFVALAFFKTDAATHHDRAAACVIGRARAGTTQHDAAGRKIRGRHNFNQVFNGNIGIVDQRDAGINNFAQIMRRHIGRHADGNARRAIDQQIGEFSRQNLRLAFRAVIVILKIDRVFIDVIDQRMRRLRHAHFGISHGGGAIAVHRAEIALTINELQTHRKALRHAHQGVVNRLVAMRVIFTDHVTDHAGRFAIGLVEVVALLAHRKQDAAMHRLQPVARVRQRTAHNHAHRVIEIRAAHFVFDGDRRDVFFGRQSAACWRRHRAHTVSAARGRLVARNVIICCVGQGFF